ncbi:hypothetical protein SLEP1_g13346 [Rubroshorea leprosula]|uniref:Uncharacterized protein n=1 Tax=Rubroshorea leprosula TaxID=152421 RepID=A0AAV5IK17_9ROSI|nr:hypothetical protein SLEP1_g13346 [Rubroshorea leprosula]
MRLRNCLDMHDPEFQLKLPKINEAQKQPELKLSMFDL